jgi:hypothetical protein
VGEKSCGHDRDVAGSSSARTCGTPAGDYSVEGFLEGKGNRARELFDGFERLIAACGPYEVAPATTRVAFMGRVSFAGVNAISDRGMTIAFGLPRPMRHPRVRKIETSAADGTGTGCASARRRSSTTSCSAGCASSYHQMGMQERLARH